MEPNTTTGYLKVHSFPVSKDGYWGSNYIGIVVENAIVGMKRYRFLTGRLRCRDKTLYSKVVAITAGLWDFNLTH